MILSTNAYTQVLTFWYVGGGNTGVSVRRSDGPQMSANTYSTVHTIIWAIQEKVSFSKTVEKLDFLLYNLLKILLNNAKTKFVSFRVRQQKNATKTRENVGHPSLRWTVLSSVILSSLSRPYTQVMI